MTSTFETLVVERRGPVEWVTLNRPERLNAITSTMADELADHLAALRDDQSVRVIVLRGAGRGFCAGLDVKERAAATEADGGERPDDGKGTSRLAEIVLALRRAPQPVVALVHGAACGGGLAFALGADIRIAGESARMNDAFVNLGLSGCELGLSYFLPRQVGFSVAAELMYTGRFIDAQRALQVGLVSQVVPDDELEAAAEALVADMLRVTPLGLRKTKETLLAAMHVDDLATVIDMEMRTQQECMRGPDFEEGLRAIIEKRPPSFASS